MRIALLEDEPYQARLIQTLLEVADYECTHFDDGEAFLASVAASNYDLFILDWELPGLSGIEVLKRIREQFQWQTPVLFTTSRNDKEDIVHALQLGADDYMVKPIDHKEFLARLVALTRRAATNSGSETTQQFGYYIIDSGERKITLAGKEIELTSKEFDLASCFFNNVGHILSREVLLERVWGIQADVTTRTIDTHVSRLRKKLALTPENGWQLLSIYHHGYRLVTASSGDTEA